MPSLHRSASSTLQSRDDKTRATVAHNVVLPTPPAQEAKVSAVFEPAAHPGTEEVTRSPALTSKTALSARRCWTLAPAGRTAIGSATAASSLGGKVTSLFAVVFCVAKVT